MISSISTTWFTLSVFSGVVHELEIGAKETPGSNKKLQPREQVSFGKKGDVFKVLSSVQTAVDQPLGL